MRTLCPAGLQDGAGWGLKQQAGDQTSGVSRESRVEGLSSRGTGARLSDAESRVA